MKLVTAGAIVVVGLAGGVAVGANIGILDSSDDPGVGSLSAAGDLTPSTQIVDVYVDGPTTTAPATTAAPITPADPATTAAVASGQVFSVDAAGTVTVDQISGTLQLTAVAPAGGWTWQLEPGAADTVAVTFTDGTRSLHFVATRSADGSVAARVDELVPAATAPAPGGGSQDDEHEDDEHEDEEHEGGEDDD